MRYEFLVPLTIGLHLLASTEGHGPQQRTWRFMGSSPNDGYNTFPLQGMQFNGVPMKTPNQFMRPVPSPRGRFFNPSAINGPQYSMPTRLSQNRVFVAVTEGAIKAPLQGVQLPIGEKLNTQLETPLQKMGDLKPTELKPADKDSELITPLVRVPVMILETAKETGLEKAMLPVEMITDVKESLTNLPISMKETAVDMIGQGLEKSTEMKSAITGMAQIPIQEMENAKEMILGKAQQTMQTSNAVKDAVVQVPLEKMEEVKELIDEKVGNPLEKASEIKDAILSPVQNAVDLKQGLNELVLNAFRQGITIGNRKESFMQAIAGMSKEELGVLQLVLQNAFNMQGLMIPVAGGLTDLKDAVQQLVMGGGDNDKKEILTQILKILDSEKIMPEVVSTMVEQGDLLNKFRQAVSNPIEQMKRLRDAIIDYPVQIGIAMKDMIMGGPLEKVENMKETVMENSVLPGATDEKLNNAIPALKRIPSQIIEDGKDMILDKAQLPIQIAIAAKDAVTGGALPKMEDIKDMVMEKTMLPVAAVENLKNVVPSLTRIPSEIIEDGKGMILDKVQLPIQVAIAAKDAFTEGVLPKMEDIKDTVMEKAMLPVAAAENLSNAILPALKRIPSQIIEDGKDMILDKAQLPIQVPIAVKDAVADSSLPKMEDLKDMLMEKAMLPLAAVENLKDSTQVKMEDVLDSVSKVANIGELKETVSSFIPMAIENIANSKPDFSEIVFNAFRQSVTGDMTDYFRKVVGSMTNPELHMLQLILMNALNSKGITLPSMGGLTDLKDAVHELITTVGSDNEKKETLSEIEHVLDGKDILTDTVTKPAETASDLKDALESSVSKGAELLPVPMSRQRRSSGYRGTQMDYQKNQTNNQKGQRGRGKRSIIYGIGTPSQELRNFPAPAGLHSPMKTVHRQINSAAPPEPYPKSMLSLSLPVVSINGEAADKIMTDIKEGLQYALQTKNDWTFAVHGTGTTGCHAVLDNLVESGDTVLALINGYWGELMANMSERLGAHVIRYNKAPGTVFTLEEIATAIRAYRPDVVAVVQGESSTGVIQPLDGVGELCEKNGALLVVDAVSSAGIQPVLMDKYKIDAVYTGSQKGLGSVGGLVAISLSPRSVEKMQNRLTPPRAYQTDLTLQKEIWNTKNPDRTRFQSLSMPLLYALREALATIVEEKIENTFKRHLLTTEHLNRGADALGLEHFVKNPKDRLIGFTLLKPPVGKDPKKIAKYMLKNYNIEISSGFGPTSGRVIRMATFGAQADAKKAANLLRALKGALNARETSV